MKHLIIGSGVIGKATGILLKANMEDVVFYDNKKSVLKNLKDDRYKTTTFLEPGYDIFWVCTAEWNVDEVLNDLVKQVGTDSTVVIRSTVSPGDTERLTKKYGLRFVAHIPEFLRAATAIDDMFNPDRVIIGCNNNDTTTMLASLFKRLFPFVPVVTTSSATSELIKLASNVWLSTQISFWNEIGKVCTVFNVNPQEVSNGCTLDKRISKYGSKMIGDPFEGFCLPKDIVTMKNAFKNKKITSKFLDMICDINKEMTK